MYPHIKIIILNWNGEKLLNTCLNSVSGINYPNFSITVIDNNSTDNSKYIIRKNFPMVDIFELNENYGYSGGYNRYFDYLNDKKVEYVMLLNNDTKVDSEILNCFNASKENFGSNAIYGAKIYYRNKPDYIWYAGGNLNLNFAHISHRGIRKKDSSNFCKFIETDYVTGCCLFTSFEIIKKLNGFDATFNMYGEDVDFCIRAADLGIKCYYNPNAKLWHDVSASIGGKYSLKKNIKKLLAYYKLIIKHYYKK